MIRLIFDRPQNIEPIELAFDENEAAWTKTLLLGSTEATLIVTFGNI